MSIEDYELMAHARRTYLAWADQASPGELTDLDLEAATTLRADTRLEGALLMDWELRDDADAAILRALRHLDDLVETELAASAIPAEQLSRYVELRRKAIRDLCERLGA